MRDILVGRRPKDFDVATSATPNEVRSVFRNCRIIGRRFRLAHVFFGDKIIETATFRASPRDEDGSSDDADLLIRRDNVFGTETEDARRRDFTINGLFYDVEKEEVIDHVEGMTDLRQQLVRTIGDPDVRFQEDPIRMLRAIKFAARLDFQIERETYRSLLRWRDEIRKAAPPRVLEEIYRLLRGGAARRSMELLAETGILPILSTVMADLFEGPGAPAAAGMHGVESEPVPEADEPEAPEAVDDEPPPREIDDHERRWRAVWADGGGRFAKQLPTPRRRGPVGSSLTPAQRQAAWRMLDAIDQAIGANHELSSAAMFTALLLPTHFDAIVGARGGDFMQLATEVLAPMVDDVRVTRRDSERMRILLTMVRRIAQAQARGAAPELSGGADLVAEAHLLHHLALRSLGRPVGATAPAPRTTAPLDDESELPMESGEPGADGEVPEGDGADGDLPRKRRRRRRGGNRP